MSSDLNFEQADLLAKRKAGFENFRKERFPVLVDFAQRLGFLDAHKILLEPSAFIQGIDNFMKEQTVQDDDCSWIATRIGYFLAELLIVQLDGGWMVDENPSSPFFCRYVVGDFSRVNNPDVIVDPFGIAMDYVKKHPSQSLTELCNSVVNDLSQS